MTLSSLSLSRYHPSVQVSTDLFLPQLGLKWDAPAELQHDFLQFIRRSRNNRLLCLASSTPYLDLTTDIWDTDACALVLRMDTPGTQTSCMDWLSSDAFVTGGHDSTLSLWREGVQMAQ